MQSISNKTAELDLLLKSSLENMDVLCFTEHWMKEDYLNLIHIDQYKLVNYFNRKKSEHGGSCIYVKNGIKTKELNYFKDLSEEKEFEMSATELVDYEFIILCIYRPPNSNFQNFLKILESIMQKIQSKKKKIFMCGDWNSNFMVDNKRTQEVKNLLESYNLTNLVRLLFMQGTNLLNYRINLGFYLIYYLFNSGCFNNIHFSGSCFISGNYVVLL